MPKIFRRRAEWQAKRGWLHVAAFNVLFAANHRPAHHAAVVLTSAGTETSGLEQAQRIRRLAAWRTGGLLQEK